MIQSSDNSPKYARESWAKDVIAVTGTIGSGKSTVIQKLKELGAFVLSADDLAHEVVAPGSEGLGEVVAHFGVQYLSSTGELDRKALGKFVFDNPGKKSELEAILHPRIAALTKERFAEALKQGKTKLVYEVPLLFESGLEKIGFKKIVVVTASDQVCIERAKKRSGISDDQARKRLKSQLPTELKISKADLVIENSGTIDQLEASVQKLFASL